MAAIDLNTVRKTIEQRLELLSLQDIESIDYVTNNGNIAVENLTDEVRDRFRNK